MTDIRREWTNARNDLVQEVKRLGFPPELGEMMAKQLGSPQAIRRMSAYLCQAKPKDPETAVDEMLAICTEIDAWKEKKASEAANAAYNEIMYRGFEE